MLHHIKWGGGGGGGGGGCKSSYCGPLARAAGIVTSLYVTRRRLEARD